VSAQVPNGAAGKRRRKSIGPRSSQCTLARNRPLPRAAPAPVVHAADMTSTSAILVRPAPTGRPSPLLRQTGKDQTMVGPLPRMTPAPRTEGSKQSRPPLTRRQRSVTATSVGSSSRESTDTRRLPEGVSGPEPPVRGSEDATREGVSPFRYRVSRTARGIANFGRRQIPSVHGKPLSANCTGSSCGVDRNSCGHPECVRPCGVARTGRQFISALA
jgi:hypothetical protein